MVWVGGQPGEPQRQAFRVGRELDVGDSQLDVFADIARTGEGSASVGAGARYRF